MEESYDANRIATPHSLIMSLAWCGPEFWVLTAWISFVLLLNTHLLPSLLSCINLFHQTKTKHPLFWINSTTRKHRSRFGLNRSTKNSTYLTNEIHKTWCNTQNCLQLHVHGGHIFPRLIQIFSCQIWWGLWEYSSPSHRRLNKKQLEILNIGDVHIYGKMYIDICVLHEWNARGWT